MKPSHKYLIFFFLICNILTISGFANQPYRALDYIRGDEYVQIANSNSKKGYYKFRHFFLVKNNFQFFIYNISEFLDCYSRETIVKTKKQILTGLKNRITGIPFILYHQINNYQDSSKDLYIG